MTASPTTQDTQAFDKTKIANETQSLRHTDKELYQNELEQVSWWYHQRRASIINYLSHHRNKDEALTECQGFKRENDETYDVKT